MAGSRPALPIQPRRIVRDAVLAGAAVRELSDFLPRHRRAAPVAHHPHPSRRAGRPTSAGLKPRPRRNIARDEAERQRPRAGIPAGRGDLILSTFGFFFWKEWFDVENSVRRKKFCPEIIEIQFSLFVQKVDVIEFFRLHRTNLT